MIIFPLVILGSLFIGNNVSFANECKSKPVIAVIDSGVDKNHSEINNSLWRDPDGQEIFGWDITNNKPNPNDTIGHGTHVSGIIVSVSKCAKILPIKFFSGNPEYDDSMSLKNFVKAIHYAIEKRVDIINYSGGGDGFNEDEYLALKEAEKAGILVVVAAGNNHRNIDNSNKFFPASYKLSNMISVASLDSNNYLLKSSNYGKNTVDIATLGSNIYSATANGKYTVMSGTSQAAAFISGLASKLLSKQKGRNVLKLKKLIYSMAKPFPDLEKKIKFGVIENKSILQF